jgi:4-azaleucine resistance transporter AzlC
MKPNSGAHPAVPHWSLAGLAQGALLSGPAMPAMAAFGVAFGMVAAQKGLTLLEATLMSALVFAGASQFVAAEIWTDSMTFAGIGTLGFITAIVNMRFVLMSASLRPWLGALPAWQAYPALSLMTDPGWLIATRYRSEGGADAAMFLGSGLAFWLIWIGATASGYLLGSRVADPKQFGLDLIMPMFFAVMLLPLWRGIRRASAWGVAGAVALAAAEILPGSWFIAAGALAGSIAAGLIDQRP